MTFPKKRTTIYMTKELIPKVDEVARREGKSRSELIEQISFTYVNEHLNNPQSQLQTHFHRPEKTCFRCGGQFRFVNKTEYHSGLVEFSCDDCLKEDRERGLVRKVLCKV